MKKIIQTLQQSLDLIDTRDRKKMQQIIRDLKTIRIRTERKIERRKENRILKASIKPWKPLPEEVRIAMRTALTERRAQRD